MVLDCFAAGDFDDLAGDHFCLPAAKEKNGFCDVLRLDKATHGDQRNDDFFEFCIDPSGLGRAVVAPIPQGLFAPVIIATLFFNP